MKLLSAIRAKMLCKIAGICIKDLLMPYAVISLKVHKWRGHDKAEHIINVLGWNVSMEISPWLAHFQPRGRTRRPQIFGNYSVTPSITAKAISNNYCSHRFWSRTLSTIAFRYARRSLEHPLDIYRVAGAPLRDFSIGGNTPAVAQNRINRWKKKRARAGSFLSRSATMPRSLPIFTARAYSHIISAMSIFGDVTYTLFDDAYARTYALFFWRSVTRTCIIRGPSHI